jgi:signal transduction histidine kinase
MTTPAKALPPDRRTPGTAHTSAGPALAAAGTPAAVARPPRWKHMRRSVVFVLSMCVGIAALLSTMRGSRFTTNLTYSLCIGLCCWIVIDAGRVTAAVFIDRLRAARGQPLLPHAGFPGWPWMVSLVVLGMVVGPVVGTAAADLMLGNQTPNVLQLGSPNSQVTMLLTVLASLGSVIALTAMERLATTRAEAEAAQRAAAENQLKLLESQLEPHMLFNTLANLRVLIALDPARAQAMLDRLISFLRATLGASRVAQHALAAEFARLGDYLALMQVRMGERLQTQFDLPQDLAGCPVPPLLLQPLVENAIKHGLEPRVAGGRIHVSAQRDGPVLVLQVRDTGAGLAHDVAAAADSTKFGLAQVRERLATLYGAQASLSLSAAPDDAHDGDGGTLAVVRLPLGAA